MEPLVGIVILTHNQLELTQNCLSELVNIRYKNKIIILIDNASTDGTYEVIKKEYPTISIIRSKSNSGVAGGRNIGLKYCFEKSVDYVFFIDNDIICLPDTVSEILKQFEMDERIVGINPLVLFSKNPYLICHAIGKYNSKLFYSTSDGFRSTDRGKYSENSYVDWLPGCAGFFKVKPLFEIGLYDEKFCPYGPEDLDISIRLRESGYKLLYTPFASVIHKQDPYRVHSNESIFFLQRGKSILIRKHGKNVIHKFFGFLWGYSRLFFIFFFKYRNLAFLKSAIKGLYQS